MKNLVDEIIDEVLKKLNIKKAFAVGSRVSEFEKYFYIVNASDEFECVIIRELENGVLGNLANGSAATHEEKLILDSLIKRKKVYVIKSGIEFLRAEKKSPLYLHYSKCLRKLKEYGAEIIGDTKIITEEIVKIEIELGADCIVCDKKTIITPLAMDYINANNMLIVRR